jgi:hypothetical protein
MNSRRQFLCRFASLAATSIYASRPVHAFSGKHASSDSADVLHVGPSRTIKTIGAAARIANAGNSIEVDAGDYLGDVAVWDRNDISIRAVGGRARLAAHGAAADGKGIWVIRASNMLIEGFDFEGAAVASRNGAGIRLESGSIRVHDCSFMHNEMGLLTNNDPETVLEVVNCEFGYNQRPDGHNHNLYAGSIASLTVIGSYFHHARIGHLLKSRAAVNHIFYNRLTDEPGGTASYELEFPNGGKAYVVGNVIEQGQQTDNPHLVRFGAEGYKWPRNEIALVNNTLVDGLPRNGIFLGVAPGAHRVRAVNNLLVGNGNLDSAGVGTFENNFVVARDVFEQSAVDDYRLKRTSGLVGKAIDPGEAGGVDLRMHAEYMHPRRTRPITRVARNPGAIQTMKNGIKT